MSALLPGRGPSCRQGHHVLMCRVILGSLPMARDRARQSLGHGEVTEAMTQQRTVLADRIAELRREAFAGVLGHDEGGGDIAGAGRDPCARSNELAKLDAFHLRPDERRLPSVECIGSFVCRYPHRRFHPPRSGDGSWSFAWKGSLMRM